MKRSDTKTPTGTRAELIAEILREYEQSGDAIRHLLPISFRVRATFWAFPCCKIEPCKRVAAACAVV
jgi:hypothetical protein